MKQKIKQLAAVNPMFHHLCSSVYTHTNVGKLSDDMMQDLHEMLLEIADTGSLLCWRNNPTDSQMRSYNFVTFSLWEFLAWYRQHHLLLSLEETVTIMECALMPSYSARHIIWVDIARKLIVQLAQEYKEFVS